MVFIGVGLTRWGCVCVWRGGGITDVLQCKKIKVRQSCCSRATNYIRHTLACRDNKF